MKFRYFFLLCLLLALLCTLCACSDPLLTIDGYEASFRGHMVELSGEYAALTDIYPGENYLKLYNDGTGVICFSDDEDEVTWSTADGGYFVNVQGEDCFSTFSGGIFSMELEGAVVTYVAEGATAPEIPTTEAPSYDTDLSSPYGNYYGLTINQYGTITDMAEFYGGESFIRLDTDGMGILCLGGAEMTIAWELNEMELTIADSNGINSIGLLSEGALVLDYMESGIQLAFAKEGANP
ncbi:MAG: hypothetical protein E7434_05625 [Ruminococcaceae bacterium]|nr:hypothetical protein [Oscillospiraceae bacterium]